MRNYAGGYLRGPSGTAFVEVTGLEPNRKYDFGVSVQCSDHCANHYLLVLPNGGKIVPTMHETCCLNLQTNQRLSCDVGIRGCSGSSFDPVHSGVYISDSTGKVVFGFEHKKSDSNPHVKFSGIKIRSCTQRLTDEAGSIELGRYNTDLNLKWKIEPTCDNVHVQLESFDIEDGFDFLYIGDESFTGTMGQKSFVLHSGFEIKFESDDSDNAEGFKINWNCPCK